MDNVESSSDLDNAQQAPIESVPKPRVEELIKKAKLSAAEKARLETEAYYQAKLEEMQRAQGMGGMAPQINEEEMYGKFREKLLAEAREQQEKAEEMQRKERASEIAKTFFDKLDKADREKYKDFDEVTSKVSIQNYPQLVQLLSGFDNADEMFYDLTSNNTKLANIDYFAKTDPKYAYYQLEKLSESIKSNAQAEQAHKSVNPPLSNVRPSISAGTDTGKMTVSDLRKKPNLRG